MNRRAQGGGRGQSIASGCEISQAAESARDYASDLGKTVSDKAGDYASTVGDYADEARRTIVDQSERLVEQARTTMQSTIGRVLQEQPLALAVAGLGGRCRGGVSVSGHRQSSGRRWARPANAFRRLPATSAKTSRRPRLRRARSS